MKALVIPKRNPSARFRLVCLPYAGGAASSYRMWPAALPESVEVWAIQLPGREGRMSERPPVRLAPMVSETMSVLTSMLDSPFALFGHSMGALMAFELARQLWPKFAPAKIFLSGCRGPRLPVRHSLHTLSESQLLTDLRRLGGTHDAVLDDQELMRVLLPAIYADLEASETYEYVPSAPLQIPITAFGGTQDPLASEQDIAAWREETSGEFRLQLFPGGHFYFRPDPQPLLQTVAGELEELTAAQRSRSTTPVERS